MKLVYMAHPVGGDVDTNLERARRWLRWIYDHYPDVAVLCHWLLDCEVLDDDIPEHRARGLRNDEAIIPRCDEFWLCGTHVSKGMTHETRIAALHNIPIRSFVHPGRDEPPTRHVEPNRLERACSRCHTRFTPSPRVIRFVIERGRDLHESPKICSSCLIELVESWGDEDE